jgi:hypothetical protein
MVATIRNEAFMKRPRRVVFSSKESHRSEYRSRISAYAPMVKNRRRDAHGARSGGPIREHKMERTGRDNRAARRGGGIRM